MDCLAASIIINKLKVPNFDGLWCRTGLGATYYIQRIDIFFGFSPGQAHASSLEGRVPHPHQLQSTTAAACESAVGQC